MESRLLLLLLLLGLTLFQLFLYEILSRSSLSFHISNPLLELIQVGANLLPLPLHLALLPLSYAQLHLQPLDLSKDIIACFNVISDLFALLLELLVSMPQGRYLLFCLGYAIVQLILASRTY